jgi:hypothetical protein
MSFFKTIGASLLGLLSLIGVHTTHAPLTSPAVSTQLAGAFSPSGGGTYRLQSSVGASDTTINLSSFLEPISSTPYTMSYFGSTIEYGTLDPQTPNQSEFISFTGVIQNANGTAQLTGVTRGLSRTPGNTGCVASSTLAQAHAGQSIFILSNSPCFYSQYTVAQNNTAITGEWTVPTPVNAMDIANKQYVDSSITGTTTISSNKLIVAGVAGTTITKGQLVYFDSGSSEWKLTNASTTATVSNVLTGIAQGNSTVGVSIGGGVLIQGLDSNQTGLSTGQTYYASATNGAIQNGYQTALAVGVAQSSTSILFSQNFAGIITSTQNNTFTGQNTFTSTTTLATSTTLIGYQQAYAIGKNADIITGTGTSTFSTPSGISLLDVTLVGAGGNGANSTNSCSGNSAAGMGGGSGSLVQGIINTQGSTTVTVYVAPANSTNATTFAYNGGYWLTAPSANSGSGGGSPTASTTFVSSIVSVNGQNGGNSTGNISGFTAIALGGTGASTKYGSGGDGSTGGGANGTAGTGYGAGGGGGTCLNGTATGDNGTAGTQGLEIVRW